MRVFGQSDVGMLRAENQDAFALLPLAAEDALLAVVCDGMGGERGGKEAADSAFAPFGNL